MSTLHIRNGTVFDGSGSASFTGDVLVRDGRIVEVSERPLEVSDAEVVDASGKWVMPGFIDNHTHYDGELLVAPQLSESVRHGVTSVVLGGCSLSFIYSDVEDCCDMFTRVEAFPREILFPMLDGQKNWSDAAGWIDHIESLPLGPNVASFLGHSDIRARVMGIERSLSKQAPTSEEVQQMRKMLNDSLDAGLIGISMQHNPWDKMDGRHWSKLLPAAYAKAKERNALTQIVRERGAHLQGVPNLVNRVAALWYMSQSASYFGLRKPLKSSMVAMMNLKGDPYIRALISGIATVFNKLFGANFRMQAFPVPFRVLAQGMELVIFEEFPTGALARHLSRDIDKRNATLQDPDYRAKFKKHYRNKLAPKIWQKDFGDAYVLESPDPSMIGKSFVELAEERQQHPVDTFLDLVVEMDQEIVWETTIGNHDPSAYAALYNDPNGIFGFADSGAHINNMAFYNNPLRVLRYVQASHEAGKPLMSMEKAIWRLTKENAEFFNLDAGSLEAGRRADVVVVDPKNLDDRVHEYHTGPFVEGAERLVNRNDDAVSLVLVNGKVAWRDGGFGDTFGEEKFGQFLPGNHSR